MPRKLLIGVLASIALCLFAGLVAWHYWTHRYDSLIVTVARRHGLEPALIKAIVYEESFFNPAAHSSQNAIGLMQVTAIAVEELIVATRSNSFSEAVAAISGVEPVHRQRSVEEALTDPEVSLDVGCWYLRRLLDRYRLESDPLAFALAAYNAGPSHVKRWAANDGLPQLTRDEFVARIDFPATRQYVKRILERFDEYMREGDPTPAGGPD